MTTVCVCVCVCVCLFGRQRALVANKKLKLRRLRIDNKLWNYFNQGRRNVAPPGGEAAKPDASAEAAIEPDGPDMQQQYRKLFGTKSVHM